MFRRPYTITRTGAGSLVRGRWIDGTQTTVPGVKMNVQPARSSDYDMLQALPEGRRVERAVRVYCNERLVVGGEGGKARGDRFTFEGETYEVSAVSPWRTTPLRHFRYLATKVLEA